LLYEVAIKAKKIMEKVLAFLFRLDDLSSLKKTLNTIQRRGNSQLSVVTFDKGVVKFLQAQNFSCHFYQEYLHSEDLTNFNLQAIKWLNEWSEQKLINGKTFPELVTYKGHSLWWCAHGDVCRDFLVVVQYIEIVLRILAQENPGQIVVIDVWRWPNFPYKLADDENLGARLVQLIARVKNLPLISVKPSLKQNFFYYVRFSKAHVKMFLYYRFYAPVKSLIRYKLFKLAQWFSSKHYQMGHQKIIFISHTRNWRNVFDYRHQKYKRDDVMIGDVIRQLLREHDYSILGIDVDYTFLGDFRTLYEKLFGNNEYPWKPLESYSDWGIMREIRKAHRQYKRFYRSFKKNEQFQRSFFYKGIPIWKVLTARLDFLFLFSFKNAIRNLRLMDRMIAIEKPLVIATSFETGSAGRAATMTARAYGIPTVGLQHGKIHPAHPHYIFSHVSTTQAPNLKYCPIPDVTMVYGDYTKRVLMNCSSYPSENVIVTGQPLADNIVRAREIFDKYKTYEKFGLDLKKKLLVLISQNFQEVEFRERMLNVTIEGMKPFNELQLFVKLHPGETPDLALRVLRNFGLNGVPVTKNVDLYEILYACDIMVTGNSTVALEAMMLDKPVITIEGFPFSMPFAQQGASLGVMTVAEMTQAIKSILNGGDVVQKLKINRKKFVREHACEPDGQAAKRVADAIIRIARRKRK